MKQIELIWRRTERFVNTLEAPPAKEEIEEGTMAFIEKLLTNERMKFIRFADREGWSAALCYLGHDIAETEAEAKAMRESKKDIKGRAGDGPRRSDR